MPLSCRPKSFSESSLETVRPNWLLSGLQSHRDERYLRCHLLGVSCAWLRSRTTSRLLKMPRPQPVFLNQNSQAWGLGISVIIGSPWTPLWSISQYLRTMSLSWNLLFYRSRRVYILQPRSETRFWIPITGIPFVFKKLIISLPWEAWIREWYGETAENVRAAKGGKFAGKKQIPDPRGNSWL